MGLEGQPNQEGLRMLEAVRGAITAAAAAAVCRQVLMARSSAGCAPPLLPLLQMGQPLARPRPPQARRWAQPALLLLLLGQQPGEMLSMQWKQQQAAALL